MSPSRVSQPSGPLTSSRRSALTALSVLGLAAIWLRAHVFSPNTWLPGPSWDSLVFGHIVEMLADPRETSLKLRAAHGSVYRIGDFYGSDRVVISDPAALQHILQTKAYDYPKPNEARGELHQVLGNGVLFAEGTSGALSSSGSSC